MSSAIWTWCPTQDEKRRVHCALSNSLGFGGHNAALVFRKVED